MDLTWVNCLSSECKEFSSPYVDLNLFFYVITVSKDVINRGNHGVFMCCVFLKAWISCVRRWWGFAGLLRYPCGNVVNRYCLPSHVNAFIGWFSSSTGIAKKMSGKSVTV